MAACWLAAALVTAAFAWILADLLPSGLPRITWRFLTGTPEQAGRAGGIAPVLVSTAGVLGTCLIAALPLGLATAVLLAEYADGHRRLGRLARLGLDLLAGVPSIVFGLFGNAFFCVALGLGYSILSGGLTLACMILPILVRSAEVALRGVGDAQRLAGAALGLSRGTLLLRVLVPAALPGLMAGLVLGIGRALAETAALLFTSGYVDRMPGSLLDSGRTLSIHVYDLAMNVAGGGPNARASALVLVLALCAIQLATAALLRRRGAAP